LCQHCWAWRRTAAACGAQDCEALLQLAPDDAEVNRVVDSVRQGLAKQQPQHSAATAASGHRIAITVCDDDSEEEGGEQQQAGTRAAAPSCEHAPAVDVSSADMSSDGSAEYETGSSTGELSDDEASDSRGGTRAAPPPQPAPAAAAAAAAPAPVSFEQELEMLREAAAEARRAGGLGFCDRRCRGWMVCALLVHFQHLTTAHTSMIER
jgi:hypothetical protein